MDLVSPLEAAGYAKALGVLAVLIAIIWGAIKEKPIWVPGWLYREKVAQCEDFKALANKALANNELLIVRARSRGGS